jgi:hypothetical protein
MDSISDVTINVKDVTNMKVVANCFRNDDWREFLTITIDGKTVFSAHDGEPEDNSLCRNFSNCKHIPSLLKLAYEAGIKDALTRGHDFSVEVTSIEEYD